MAIGAHYYARVTLLGETRSWIAMISFSLGLILLHDGGIHILNQATASQSHNLQAVLCDWSRV